MLERATFDRIRDKHGSYASWAVWAPPSGRPKSNIGDLGVLDPDRNPGLLATLRGDVVMLGLNLSRFHPRALLANFHDLSPAAQDYKIRFAFAGTPCYGAYMTDLIKDRVVLASGDLMREVVATPTLVRDSVELLLEELDDLDSATPTIIAFGRDTYRLAASHVPSSRVSRLIGVMHYSNYISQEEYRRRVLADLDN